MQSAYETVCRDVHFAGFAAGTGNDKRSARFVDQDAVHLVDDYEIKSALNTRLTRSCHIVPQVVETKFVVGSVGNIASVCRAFFPCGGFCQSYADGQAQKTIHLAHPLGVTSGKIFVHGDNVNALSGECV